MCVCFPRPEVIHEKLKIIFEKVFLVIKKIKSDVDSRKQKIGISFLVDL